LLSRGIGSTTYAIWDGCALKIGKCAGHPQVRLRELQTGNPRRLQLLAWTVELTERDAHRKLSSERLRAEWFAVSIKTLTEVASWTWLGEGLWHSLRRAAAQTACLLDAARSAGVPEFNLHRG
jgi:hypothetical protein